MRHTGVVDTVSAPYYGLLVHAIREPDTGAERIPRRRLQCPRAGPVRAIPGENHRPETPAGAWIRDAGIERRHVVVSFPDRGLVVKAQPERNRQSIREPVLVHDAPGNEVLDHGRQVGNLELSRVHLAKEKRGKGIARACAIVSSRIETSGVDPVEVETAGDIVCPAAERI